MLKKLCIKNDENINKKCRIKALMMGNKNLMEMNKIKKIESRLINIWWVCLDCILCVY